MYSFITAILLLVLGYFMYGAFVEKIFNIDKSRQTPCYVNADGVDYVPMPTWKVFLIQFLNIAGTGPIFGAIQGVLFGPAAYLWIVFGCVLGGAVHDYLSGMVSLRFNGASLPEIVGNELGDKVRFVLRVLSLILMVLVGTVFVTTPAGLLGQMTRSLAEWTTPLFWCVVIFIYYICATLLPIDALIGRIYPLFGLALLIMAVGVFFGIFLSGGTLPEINEGFQSHHPKGLALLPMLCITIACGAVSGFHATQSPMMARCIKNEKHGRLVFYGAMITEGIVAMIWAAAAIKFADALPGDGLPYEKLLAFMTVDGKINPAIVVDAICHSWLGTFGAALAILGVVAAPITSGDTAFRCARLIVSDFLKIKQHTVIRRLLVSIPLFAIAVLLMNVNFDVLWRYFAWFNQTLSVFTLWALTVWLGRNGKLFIITLIPAVWMTFICSSYILVAPEGFGLDYIVACGLGVLLVLVLSSLYFGWYIKLRKEKTILN